MATEAVNILLVDDQPAKLLTYELILKELGQNLLKANSAIEALEILLKTDVAIVLTDVCMPELDGFELASILREHPRHEQTAVIFISAVNLSVEDRARGYRLGAVDYVSVPVVPEILRAKVKLFVDLYRNTRKIAQLNRELENRVQESTIELREANFRLRESEERLRLASEAAGFGTYDYNVAADSIHCSLHLKRLLGTDISGDMSLAAFLSLVHRDDQAAVHDAMLSSGEVEVPHEIEFRTSPDTGDRWLLDRGRSFETSACSEKPSTRTMGTILDITRRKRMEERQQMLIAELDHRVRNVMANVLAMARLSGRRATSTDTFITSLEGRLQSMASTHGLLSNGDWNGTELGELAHVILAPLRSARGDNIVVNGERLDVRPRMAQDLALILHELATNAVKHGALSVQDGRVEISWSPGLEPGCTRLIWRETGGPVTHAPDSTGLGLSLIQTALSDEGATVSCDFRPGGLVCTIDGCFGNVAPAGPSFDTLHRRKPSPPQRTSNLRVLLVEDEPLVSMLLRFELLRRGCTVLGPVSSLGAGLKMACEEEFDVALLDVRLGHQTSEQIAALLIERGIPFAITTGYTDQVSVPEPLRTHMRLSKPYMPEDVDLVLGFLAQKLAERRSNEGQHPPRRGATASDPT